MKYTIAFFTNSQGDAPIKIFIRHQDARTIAKILKLIELLEEFGYGLRMPYVKKVGTNLYELRSIGSQSIRIFYTFKRNTIILLHGFKKKTAKTPKKEIRTAIDRMRLII